MTGQIIRLDLERLRRRDRYSTGLFPFAVALAFFLAVTWSFWIHLCSLLRIPAL